MRTLSLGCHALPDRLAVDMKLFIHIHIHIHRFSVDIHGYIYIHRLQMPILYRPICRPMHGISAKRRWFLLVYDVDYRSINIDTIIGK